MKQFVLTPATGKRLIGKAIVKRSVITKALKKGSVVIVAGTTNGYVAEEILNKHGQAKAFRRDHFYRGIILPLIARQLPQEEAMTKVSSRAMWSSQTEYIKKAKLFSMLSMTCAREM